MRVLRQYIGLLISLSTALAISAVVPQSSSCASPNGDSSPGGLDEIFKNIQELVKEYYPKAKISISKETIHFQDKVRDQERFYSGRIEPTPQSDGIIGELSLKPGQYQGADKDRLPSEVADGFNNVLVMAPYSKQLDSHLFGRLVFPKDTSVDFKDRFKNIVRTFNAGDVISQSPPEPSVPSAKEQQSDVKNVNAGEVTAQNSSGVTLAAKEQQSEVRTVASASVSAPASASAPVFAGTKLTKYSYPEGRFRVLLPGNPKMTYKNQNGLRLVDYAYPDPQGCYEISYMIMPREANPERINMLFDKVGAAMVLGMKADKVKQASLSLQGFPGRQLEFGEIKGKPKVVGRMALYSVRRYVYIVAAIGTKEWLGCPAVNEFWRSFSFTPELTAQEKAQQAFKAAANPRQSFDADAERRRRESDAKSAALRSSVQKSLEHARAQRQNNGLQW